MPFLVVCKVAGGRCSIGNPILLVIARFSSENRGNPEKKSLKKVKNFQKKINLELTLFLIKYIFIFTVAQHNSDAVF